MSYREQKVMAVVLAAGKGSRMKSGTPKVLSLLNEKPLIDYVIQSLSLISQIDKIVLVLGYKKDLVEEHCKKYNVDYAYQKDQNGTADAVFSAKSFFSDFSSILVTCGDMPFISMNSFKSLIDLHHKNNDDMTILTANFSNPYGYGRIVRDADNKVFSIVEEKDATVFQKKNKEVNTGTYLFKTSSLTSFLSKIGTNNKQGEYYLTDLVNIYYQNSLSVSSLCLKNQDESLGINSREDLIKAEKILETLSL